MSYFAFKITYEISLVLIIVSFFLISLIKYIRNKKDALVYSFFSLLFNLTVYFNAPLEKITITYIQFRYFLLISIGLSFFLVLISFKLSTIRSLRKREVISLLFSSILMLTLIILPLSTGVGNITNRVSLSAPFKSGEYYIIQGGDSYFLNAHYFHKSQRYALDIVKNCEKENIYKNEYKENHDFCIWGEPVISVCDGEVMETQDGLKDNLLSVENDRANPKGNFVEILCDSGEVILYAHLMLDSILVSKNLKVKIGDNVGKVGNSGNSTEPHLHIQANLDNEPLVLRINGAVFKRYDKLIIRSKE